MTAYRKDHNQNPIVAALHTAGAYWHDMTQKRPSVGYDGICIYNGRMYPCEIKMPGKEDDLTATERKIQECYAVHGVNVHILETIEDALEMIGAWGGGA